MTRPLAGLALAALLVGCGPERIDAPVSTASDAADAITDSVDSVDTERPDWADAFASRGGRGTFVLHHTASGRTERLAPDLAARRRLPASTFKVYNALVALDTGVLSDPDSLFAWDGRPRQIAAWNRDHSLRTGMEVSALWLFQRLAERIGRDRYADAFAREPYGNARLGEALDLFWIDGSLRISADEQVRFLDRLRTGDTGFSASTEATVRDLLPTLADGPGARLRAKTGWGFETDAAGGRTPVGWLIGWVERGEADGGDVVFALNVEPAGEAEALDMGPARLAIARDILAREDILPADR